MAKPLKRLLLRYELAFLVILLVTGAMGAMWAFFWQQTSVESVRLGNLQDAAQQVRTDLFRQIKEVTWARLREDPEAFQLYAKFSRKIDNYFKQLHDNAESKQEVAGIEDVRQSYRIIEKDMNKIFTDPYIISRVVRLRMLDPTYERNMVAYFDQTFDELKTIINDQQVALEKKMMYWTGLAPYLIAIPILISGMLFFFSRSMIQKQVVHPVKTVREGASMISKGEFNHNIPQQGVMEMAELAGTINEMASELARNRDALVESEKQAALGALVPVVAHNIRNPLASISASIQLLEYVDTIEEKREIKEAVMETVDRLGRWVSALVSYLHPLQLQFRQLRLTELFETIVKMLQSRLEEKEITIEHPQWDESLTAQFDPDLMEQALYGLISNAIDASPQGGTIRLSVSSDNLHGRLTIEDQGGGMPFEPKPNDLTPGRTTKQFGTGLGIPVAFKVCNKHGWKLSYENLDGAVSGTRVIIKTAEIQKLNG